MSNDVKANVEWSHARMNIYAILAEVFRSEPTPAFLDHLRDPGTFASLESLGFPSWEQMFPSSHEKLGEDLAVEYTRLFIGPGPRAFPNESMNIDPRYGEDNELWSEQTVAVKKFMEAAGITLRDDFSGMPDHIAAEFEFMHKLIEAEQDARDAGDAEVAQNILKIQARFYDEHISRWVPNFCDKVVEGSFMPFYAAFAEMTKGFVTFEHENLSKAVKATA